MVNMVFIALPQVWLNPGPILPFLFYREYIFPCNTPSDFPVQNTVVQSVSRVLGISLGVAGKSACQPLFSEGDFE